MNETCVALSFYFHYAWSHLCFASASAVSDVPCFSVGAAFFCCSAAAWIFFSCLICNVFCSWSCVSLCLLMFGEMTVPTQKKNQINPWIFFLCNHCACITSIQHSHNNFMVTATHPVLSSTKINNFKWSCTAVLQAMCNIMHYVVFCLTWNFHVKCNVIFIRHIHTNTCTYTLKTLQKHEFDYY